MGREDIPWFYTLTQVVTMTLSHWLGSDLRVARLVSVERTEAMGMKERGKSRKFWDMEGPFSKPKF